MKQTLFKKDNIPNLISSFRILIVPLYILLFFRVIPTDRPLTVSGILFIVAGLSDALDGFLARRNRWISDIGKLLDPLADKLLEIAVVISIAIRFGGPFVILAAIIITKEAIMIIGAYLIMSKSKVYVSSVWCGKLATLVWYVLICSVHFLEATSESMTFCNILCIILILVMVMAFVGYVLNYATQIQTMKDVMISNKHKPKAK